MRARVAAPLVLTGVAIATAWGARGLRLGSASSPGPGFFPFGIGLGLVLVSLAILFVEWRAPRVPSSWPLGRVAPTVGMLLLSAPALGLLGFVATSVLFLLVLLRRLGSSWRTALAVAVTTSLVSHLVFVVWLQIRFPRGVFGF